jgi:hypothetical protein
MRDLQILMQEIASVRREVRNLIVMGMRPGMTPSAIWSGLRGRRRSFARSTLRTSWRRKAKAEHNHRAAVGHMLRRARRPAGE